MIRLQWSVRVFMFTIAWLSYSAVVAGQPPAGKHSRAATPRVNVIVDPFAPYIPIPGHDAPHELPPIVIQSRGSHHVADLGIPLALAQDAFSAEIFRRHAETAFYAVQYDQSLRMLRHAMIEDAADGKLHLLLSHTQLAIGDYSSAARSLLQAMVMLDQRDWGLYLRREATSYAPGEHARMLGGLSQYIKEHPKDAAAYLIRGYHRLFVAQKSRARQDLLAAVTLDNQLELPAKLWQMTEAPIAPENVPPPVPARE
ncbi:MAG: hypothetical protein WBF93_17200 [Pirellulales bacterium]